MGANQRSRSEVERSVERREYIVLHQHGDDLIKLRVQSCGKLTHRDRVAERKLGRTVQWSLKNLGIQWYQARIALRLRRRHLSHNRRCARFAKIALGPYSEDELSEKYGCRPFIAFVAKHDREERVGRLTRRS